MPLCEIAGLMHERDALRFRLTKNWPDGMKRSLSMPSTLPKQTVDGKHIR
ncbi:methyltransferase-like protein 22 isoform X3 (plasmid) [Acetobacter orientalis]|uniref:Methyltransferase-like protein 22 isoform X3 n=1 Tax=Acetobacter orientalis TaxID=146474 RepID=A0A2Z5ZML8_9PROT|nr:methyltransferase-like protein 22 isoform X3 [Acetobacter orientalis]